MEPTTQPSEPSSTTSEYEKPCGHCGKTMRGMPSFIARRKFCSKDCAGASKRKVRVKEWVTLTCKQCQKPFEVTPAWVRNGRRKFCSKACHGRFWALAVRPGKRHTPESRAKMGKGNHRRGERSSQWKGGTFLSPAGYRYVLVSTLSAEAQAMAGRMKFRKPYILEHRIVASMELGRPVKRSEVVHHLNGQKADNRPENLVVVPRAAHSVSHRQQEIKLFRLERENAKLRLLVEDLRSKLASFRPDGRNTSN